MGVFPVVFGSYNPLSLLGKELWIGKKPNGRSMDRSMEIQWKAVESCGKTATFLGVMALTDRR